MLHRNHRPPKENAQLVSLDDSQPAKCENPLFIALRRLYGIQPTIEIGVSSIELNRSFNSSLTPVLRGLDFQCLRCISVLMEPPPSCDIGNQYHASAIPS